MTTERVLVISRCRPSACLQKQSGNMQPVVVAIWRSILGVILIYETQKVVCLPTSNLVAVTSTTMVLHTHHLFRRISLMTTVCMTCQVMFRSGVLMISTLHQFLLCGILNPQYIDPRTNPESSKYNPRVPPKKVVRGGSWKDVAYYLETGTRTYEFKDSTRAYIGFRCAMTHLGPVIRSGILILLNFYFLPNFK